MVAVSLKKKKKKKIFFFFFFYFFFFFFFFFYFFFFFGCFFFFQAEDGIRDRDVTGVQTCALPISEARIDIMASVGVLRWFAGFADRIDGRLVASNEQIGRASCRERV